MSYGLVVGKAPPAEPEDAPSPICYEEFTRLAETSLAQNTFNYIKSISVNYIHINYISRFLNIFHGKLSYFEPA